MQRRKSGAAGFNRKNRKLAKAMTASIESLERRQMLSIAASTLRGPLDAGDTWTYAETDSDNQSSGITEVDTSKGKTEFQGNEATEIDSVITNNSNADTDTDQQYFGFDSTGDYVEYGDVDTSIIGNDTDVDTTTDTPTAVVFPSPLTGGVTVGPISYTKNESDVFNGGEPSTGSTDVSISFELDSEATSPLITPAGTFEVYDITIKETDTDNEADPPTVTSSTTNVYVDPKVGEIEIANTSGAELVLQSYSLTNGGGGGGGGDTGGTGGVLTPTITKDTVPAAVVGGATLHGADLTVDVTNSGDGADKGFILNVYASTDTTLDTSTDQVVTSVTKTTLVGGHKTVVDSIPITQLPAILNGTYYLIVQAVDSASNAESVASSSTVEVAPPFVTLTETLSTKLPAALVSDSPVKGGSVTLTITNSGNVDSKGVTPIDVTASTVSGEVGTSIATLSKSLTILPGKSTKVVIPIKSIPALATDDYFIVAQTTDPFAGDVSLASSTTTTNIAAAFIMLAGTLGPASLKTGDVLTITNNGNVPYVSPTISGVLGFSLDAAGAVPAGSTLPGAVKTPHIAVGKSAKIHLTEWSSILSSLTKGVPYYLTVTFSDGNGGTVLAVSTTTFTLA